MILEVPFKFSVGGRKEGNAINSTSSRWDVAKIAIPELSDDEAPVAVEWYDADTFVFNEERPVAADGMQHTRFHDEQHWLPVLSYTLLPGGGIDRLTASAFADGISAGRGIGALAVPHGAKRRAEDDAYKGFDTVSFSSRDKIMQSMVDITRDLIVVDGMMYRRATEPKITVGLRTFETRDQAGARRSGYGTLVRLVAERDLALTTDLAVFPIDRFEAAITYAKRRNTGSTRRVECNEDNLRRRPVISDFRTSETPGSHVAIVEAYAKAFVSAFEKIVHHEIDTQSIRLYADVRDALAALPSESAIEDIESAAQAFLARHEKHARLLGQMTACVTFIRGAYETASARPIDATTLHRDTPHASR